MQRSYDVVIIGGAIMGSALAWWLSQARDFVGSIAVLEMDPSYEFSSTAHTNSCMRQQFSTPMNIKISQFAADFVNNFREFMKNPEAPDLPIQSYGYMYLACDNVEAKTLRDNQRVQLAAGTETRLMTPDEISAEYPFYNVDDVVLASINTKNEGYFDGGSMFDWWRKQAKANAVDYIHAKVVSIARSVDGMRVTSVSLESGETISCGMIVNATGPRANMTAQLAGLHVPVEPRRRYTYVFEAAEPLQRDLPLTIDPSGVHFRTDGRYYLAGCPPMGEDKAMEPDDFGYEDNIWEEKLWPAMAHRIPAFERLRVMNSWVGHYAYNVLDKNAILGPHPEVKNFYFMNGFSGHGFQQSPAIGRGLAELIMYGEYKSIDLSAFSYQRVLDNQPIVEKSVI